ncbi:hypothetical protein C8J57DRAFT_1520412 [Mycena rebaudengoi]|nr:hypothetical protein C8J57DRAFT_1525675 [Mycena rebaudengoi]KAJ7251600.1 hypothetical protein C8J57DRAFT_1520412 [Mycena rebaudengoi]
MSSPSPRSIFSPPPPRLIQVRLESNSYPSPIVPFLPFCRLLETCNTNSTSDNCEILGPPPHRSSLAVCEAIIDIVLDNTSMKASISVPSHRYTYLRPPYDPTGPPGLVQYMAGHELDQLRRESQILHP